MWLGCKTDAFWTQICSSSQTSSSEISLFHWSAPVGELGCHISTLKCYFLFYNILDFLIIFFFLQEVKRMFQSYLLYCCSPSHPPASGPHPRRHTRMSHWWHQYPHPLYQHLPATLIPLLLIPCISNQKGDRQPKAHKIFPEFIKLKAEWSLYKFPL